MTPRGFAPVFAYVILSAASAYAAEPILQTGSYEIRYSLELPHLERYAVTRTRSLCIDAHGLDAGIPLPVLGGNKAFDVCSAENIQIKETSLSYRIVCKGRAAARAVASYDIRQNAFKGRVAMVLGAKNMTMTEVQTARRIGACDLASN